MLRTKRQYEEQCRLIEANIEIANFEARKEFGRNAPIIKPEFPQKPYIDMDLIRPLESPRTIKARYEYSPNIKQKFEEPENFTNAMKHGCPCCNPDIYYKPRAQSRLISTAPNRNRCSYHWSLYGSGPYHRSILQSRTHEFQEPLKDFDQIPNDSPLCFEEKTTKLEDELANSLCNQDHCQLTRRKREALSDLARFEEREKAKKRKIEKHEIG